MMSVVDARIVTVFLESSHRQLGFADHVIIVGEHGSIESIVVQQCFFMRLLAFFEQSGRVDVCRAGLDFCYLNL